MYYYNMYYNNLYCNVKYNIYHLCVWLLLLWSLHTVIPAPSTPGLSHCVLSIVHRRLCKIINCVEGK